jgi:hypothetical protein
MIVVAPKAAGDAVCAGLAASSRDTALHPRLIPSGQFYRKKSRLGLPMTLASGSRFEEPDRCASVHLLLHSVNRVLASPQ